MAERNTVCRNRWSEQEETVIANEIIKNHDALFGPMTAWEAALFTIPEGILLEHFGDSASLAGHLETDDCLSFKVSPNINWKVEGSNGHSSQENTQLLDWQERGISPKSSD
ncbi:hypothetical protein DPMN_015886 [Dreissena polymorpha]|uniref:Uncharacterized protein n=1 Tax=Dreissena polymorpha TaxID=45954 RepID=A0A9D4S600_DREPO|nr:hypothetical protein DPMN_015886 [Dreissena polymorpha]